MTLASVPVATLTDAQSATLLDRPAALAVIVGRLAACRYEEVVAASG